MFDSGIPGLPRLIALRGLGRFFGFTFFAICHLLGLLAFQAELMPDCLFVVEARATWMDAYSYLCIRSTRNRQASDSHPLFVPGRIPEKRYNCVIVPEPNP
jgi:hypothetical protein